MPDERPSQSQQQFCLSAQEMLQTLNEKGMRLEAAPRDPELLWEIRHLVETLQRNAAACEFRELSDLAYELEQLLTPEVARAARVKLAELVVSAAEMFDAMMTAYRCKLPASTGDPLRATIRKLAQSPSAAPSEEELRPRFQWNDHEQHTIQAAVGSGQTVYNVALGLAAEPEMRAATLQLLSKVLRENFCVLAIYPEPISGSDANRVEAAIQTDQGLEWVVKICRVPGLVRQIAIEEILPLSSCSQPASGAR